VVREGDVFGRAVNRAARLADVAGAGQLLAPDTLAATLADARILREPVGSILLQRIAEPTSVVRLRRRDAAGG
jgi:class 3 adenylate cyclase